MFGAIGLSLIFSIALCIHAVRTNQQLYWLFIILAIQPVGGFVYLLAIVAPEFMGGSAARRLAQEAKTRLDPTKAYRLAKEACDDSPTAGNRMRLAAAAFDLGRYDEAEEVYRLAAQGIHEDDTAMLMGRASALVELQRYEEALVLLNRLGELGEKGRTAHAAMAMGRAYQGLGRFQEADDAYEWAAPRFAGLEAIARYCAFLVVAGRRAEAEQLMGDIERRAAKSQPHFRKEARYWRDFAAEAVAGKA